MQADKVEDAAVAAATPSDSAMDNSTINLSNFDAEVNPCLRLREICQTVGKMDMEITKAVQAVFPKFDRQAMAKCKAWEKYGVIIHPAALLAICEAYGIPVDYQSPRQIRQSIGSPEKLTQKERILRHLNDFGSITTLEAVTEYGIMRLASRICDLRKLGYNIISNWETRKNRYNEPVRYVRYTIGEALDER